MISELSKYSVCCSYDDVRRFRYSAAVHVAHNYDEVGFGVCERDIVKHCIYDNCDAEILSPNCKRCFLCLAMIMAQVRSPSISSPAELDPMQKTIKRQPRQHLFATRLYLVNLKYIKVSFSTWAQCRNDFVHFANRLWRLSFLMQRMRAWVCDVCMSAS